MIYRYLGSALALLMLQGCATDPAPDEQMRLTEQVVEQAQTVVAGQQSDELALAQAKLQQAREAMDEQAYRRARIQAEQAELDARLGEARALTAKSDAQLIELNRRIERLRQQLEAMP